VLYRSLTEARQAKFFQGIGLKFEYEVQGFDLGDSVWYRPDFLLLTAGGHIWAEVKAGWNADPEGEAKFRRFVAMRPQPSRAALIVGQPATGPGHVIVFGGDENDENPLRGPWADDTQEWRPCGSGHHFDLACAGTFRSKFAEDGCKDNFGGDGEERIERAVEAALSARFSRGAA
jgi:hypothetical protein